MTEEQYKEYIKKAILELVQPLTPMDQLDLILRLMPGMSQERMEKVIEALGFRAKEAK